MAKRDSVVFDREALFTAREDGNENVKNYREELYRKFSRNMVALLESRRPKRYSSTRGLLNTRKLFRHQIDDSVFYKNTSVPASDTTFVFLIDNSGSMSSGYLEYGDSSLNNLQQANAIVSAFAKANKAVLSNKIKVEVFAKSECGECFNGFVKGYVPILSRIFSNVNNDTEWDRILDLDTHAPVMINNQPAGSYTPEFLLLPALMEWAKKNITTRNMVVVNLTDGEVCHTFIDRTHIKSYKDSEYRNYSIPTKRAYNEDTKRLRIKYLRGVPSLTLYLGNRFSSYEENSLFDIYGTNTVLVNGDNFATEFFKTLNHLLNEYA